jgi:2-polyprenyl-6-hydroxyphenyl methylase/3-demethylubiquinone-9 3-methyltransferase
MRKFDFGENWSDFSSHALTADKIRQAQRDFAGFMARAGADISGKSFLDVGFGQGLSLLSAKCAGTVPVGCDINPKCAQVLERNRSHFRGIGSEPIPVVVGSILEKDILEKLRTLSSGRDGFDIVHSWGVLHHTGRMWQAIDNAASLVRPGGMLFLALYNRHWTSPAWTVIKRLYVQLPSFLQSGLVAVLYPVILAAKWAVTRQNPMIMDRGMDFYYNVVDWVGGYPYEYASREEVIRYLVARKFELRHTSPSVVPTGCNEFAFIRLE